MTRDNPTPAPAAESNQPSTRRRRKWLFRAFAVLCGLLPFVAIEVALRAFDVGRPTELSDPFVGFSDLHPQFELDEDAGEYVTTKSRRLFFGTERFATQKPENGYRAFVLGGSTVRGRPYTTETAFAKWMQIQLSECDPESKYEIVNCGGLSYASYRLRPMTEEVLNYEPDLIVIATGHNEFLEDRTYQHIKEQSESERKLSKAVYSLRIVTAARQLFGDQPGAVEDKRTRLKDTFQTRLDNETGYASYHRDDEWRDSVREHFKHSLRAMVAMCQQKKVPVILLRLGFNLRDCPPFKSEHKPGLSEEDRLKWQSLFDEATEQDRNAVAKALELYQQAAKIDDEHALLCFRMARCFDRLKQYEQAKKYYRRAKEFDVCPLRMLDSMADDVAEIAKETGVPLIDVASMFERQSPQGIPGNNFYMDHVHPSIGGHQQIARAIVERLHKDDRLPKGYKPWSDSQRREAYQRQFRTLGPSHFASGRTRLGWLENWARRQEMLTETLPLDRRGYLHYGHRRFDLGEPDMAWKEYMTAYRRSPKTLDDLLFRSLDLFQQGRYADTGDMLEKLRNLAEPPLRNEVDLARLVLALETGDKLTALNIAKALGNEIASVSKDSPWRAVMPNAMERARKIDR